MSPPGPGTERRPADVVVLSPHLDDAVLSLGALIARLVAQGRRVEVWTAFTAGPDLGTLPRGRRAFGDYAVRIAEDDRALDLLGAGRRRFGLPERIWREPRPATLAGAFRTPPDLAGFSALPTLVELVRQALSRPEVEVYAPLGIGHHVDHVELAAAAVQAALGCDALARVAFYEDFYALGEALRRQHPVTRQQRRPALQSPGWSAPLFGMAIRMTALLARGPGLDDYLPAVRRLGWRCEPQPVDGFEQAKLDAVAQYGSQVSRLGGGRRLEVVLRRGHRTGGGELIWRAGPAQVARGAR